MTDRIHMRPITEPDKIESLLTLVEGFMENPYHLKLLFVQSRNWAVVPVESAYHFLPEDAEFISFALHSLQLFECLAIATEDLGKNNMCHRVATTKEGLLEFSHECALFNYALSSENLSFVVLCTVDDYYLVAGPADFVTKAVGKDIQAAKQDFFEFATDEGWRDYMREMLLSVYRRYEPFDGEKAMKSDKAVIRVLSRFAKDGDQVLDEFELKGIELKELQTLFQRPAADPMSACYPVSQTEAQSLQQYVNEPIDLASYDYFVECYAVNSYRPSPTPSVMTEALLFTMK